MNTSNDSVESVSPLIPVAETPDTAKHTVDIPDEVRIPLSELGTERATDSPGSIKHHIRGICGEYAVAKFFGIEEQVDTEIYEYGDPGWDLTYRDNTIDVKTVGPRANNPCLMVNDRKPISADFYVLVQELSSRSYRLIGYAPACMVKTAPVRRIRYEGYADRVKAVEQVDLFHIPRPSSAYTL